MKIENKPNLRFDSWRKEDFDQLLRAFIKAYENESNSEDVGEKAKFTLDKYTDKGSGGFGVGTTDWESVRTMSREWCVYEELEDGKIKLSSIAQDLLDSKITTADYFTNYLLNLNKIINNKIVHPLYELLDYIETSKEVNENDEYEFYKIDIENISTFNLSGASKKDEIVNSFKRRMEAAEIITLKGKRNPKLIISKDKLDNLKSHCYIWDKTVEEFKKLKNDVRLISKKNKFVYKNEGK